MHIVGRRGGKQVRNPVSKHPPIRFSLSEENERADARRDGRICPAKANPQANGGRGKFISSAEPTASRIGNHTRLINSLM